MGINWELYVNEQAELQTRDDIEFFQRHKSPRNPGEGHQETWFRTEAYLSAEAGQYNCCGEVMDGTGNCRKGGICLSHFHEHIIGDNGPKS